MITKTRLIVHIKIHHKQQNSANNTEINATFGTTNPYYCIFCHKTYSSQSYLQHCKTAHQRGIKKSKVTSVDNSKYVKSKPMDSLKKHKVTHGDQPSKIHEIASPEKKEETKSTLPPVITIDDNIITIEDNNDSPEKDQNKVVASTQSVTVPKSMHPSDDSSDFFGADSVLDDKKLQHASKDSKQPKNNPLKSTPKVRTVKPMKLVRSNSSPKNKLKTKKKVPINIDIPTTKIQQNEIQHVKETSSDLLKTIKGPLNEIMENSSDVIESSSRVKKSSSIIETAERMNNDSVGMKSVETKIRKPREPISSRTREKSTPTKATVVDPVPAKSTKNVSLSVKTKKMASSLKPVKKVSVTPKKNTSTVKKISSAKTKSTTKSTPTTLHSDHETDIPEEETTSTLYHCSKCKQGFKTQKKLIYHISDSHSTVSYCTTCQTMFEKKSEYYQHRISIHKANTEWVLQGDIHCECDRKFSTLTAYRNHAYLIHDEKTPDPTNSNLFCHSCLLTLPTQVSFNQHMEQNHGVTIKPTLFSNNTVFLTYDFEFKNNQFKRTHVNTLDDFKPSKKSKTKDPIREKYTYTSFLKKKSSG